MTADPFNKGRMIDLSLAALHMTGRGLMKVTVVEQ
jgi:rare lipoprotein A (peptidoglycan hydrolase)